MNTLILLVAAVVSQDSMATQTILDTMTTQEQKEWLLANMAVDLHFNEERIANWEKKLDAMTPTQIAVSSKAYILQQEKRRLAQERSQALKLAKIQAQGQTYWYKYYNRSRYYHYNNYPSYGYYRSPSYYPFQIGQPFTIPTHLHAIR